MKKENQTAQHERKILSGKADGKKLYKRKMRSAYAITFALIWTGVMLSAAVIFCISHALIYRGGQFTLLENSFVFSFIIMTVFVSIPIAVGMLTLFGKKTVSKIIHESYEQDIENDTVLPLKKLFVPPKTRVKLAGAAFIALGILFLILFAVSDIGFYSDHIRIKPDTALFTVEDIAYKDIDIYRIDGYYNGKKFVPYKNGYGIKSKNFCYDLGELPVGGEFENRLFSAAKENNKEIQSVKSAEDLEQP